MMAPGETFADYMLDLEDFDHHAHNAKIREEIVTMTLKSGWCLTNTHHICPVEYVNPKTPKCDCPCHEGKPLPQKPEKEVPLEEMEGFDLI